MSLKTLTLLYLSLSLVIVSKCKIEDKEGLVYEFAKKAVAKLPNINKRLGSYNYESSFISQFKDSSSLFLNSSTMHIFNDVSEEDEENKANEIASLLGLHFNSKEIEMILYYTRKISLSLVVSSLPDSTKGKMYVIMGQKTGDNSDFLVIDFQKEFEFLNEYVQVRFKSYVIAYDQLYVINGSEWVSRDKDKQELLEPQNRDFINDFLESLFLQKIKEFYSLE